MERRLVHHEKMQEQIVSHVKNSDKEFSLKQNIDEVVIHVLSLQQLEYKIKHERVLKKRTFSIT